MQRKTEGEREPVRMREIRGLQWNREARRREPEAVRAERHDDKSKTAIIWKRESKRKPRRAEGGPKPSENGDVLRRGLSVRKNEMENENEKGNERGGRATNEGFEEKTNKQQRKERKSKRKERNERRNWRKWRRGGETAK